MTFETFRESLALDAPPAGLPPLLVALWHQGKGDWQRSHEITQEIDSREASWVHAHLHRVEGDLGNADYWYRRAGRQRPDSSLDAEWDDIAAALLAASSR